MTRFCVGIEFFIEASSREEAILRAHGGEGNAYAVTVQYCHKADEGDEDYTPPDCSCGSGLNALECCL